MRKFFTVLTHRLNNIRFHKKMMLIYIICIFIPMFFTNMFYFQTMKSRTEAQWQNDMQYSLKAVRDALQNYVIQSAILIDRLILDESIYKDLDFQYSKYSDRTNFIDRMNSIMAYAAPGLQLENVAIYTENPTLPGSGRILPFNSQARESQWYHEYTKTGNNMVVIAYSGGEGRRKTVSIVREANFYPKYQYKWFVKQDLSGYFLDNIFNIHNNIDAIFIVDANGETILSYSSTQGAVLLSDYNTPGNKRFLSAEEDLSLGNGWRLLAYTKREKIDVMRGGGLGALLLLVAVNIIYATLFIIFITKTFVSRLKSLELCMEKMAQSKFEPIESENPSRDEIGLLTKGVNNAVRMIKSLIEDVYQARMRELEIENEKRRAELNALLSQINPHFIYNVLETIRMDAVVKEEPEIADIIKCVSKIFRRSVNQSEDIIPISEELEFIREYAKIEKYRFGEELTINIKTDDNVLNVPIPKMILQILLENACIHGIQQISGEKRIDIKIISAGCRIYGSVTDNGKGMPQERIESIMLDKEPKNYGIGLQNLISRLRLYYGDKFDFKIESPEGGGLIVSFNIPHKPEVKI